MSCRPFPHLTWLLEDDCMAILIKTSKINFWDVRQRDPTEKNDIVDYAGRAVHYSCLEAEPFEISFT